VHKREGWCEQGCDECTSTVIITMHSHDHTLLIADIHAQHTRATLISTHLVATTTLQRKPTAALVHAHTAPLYRTTSHQQQHHNINPQERSYMHPTRSHAHLAVCSGEVASGVGLVSGCRGHRAPWLKRDGRWHRAAPRLLVRVDRLCVQRCEGRVVAGCRASANHAMRAWSNVIVRQ
jgi:hypothetical protein